MSTAAAAPSSQLVDTVTAIRATGYTVDGALWAQAAECQSKCSQCYAGCSDTPNS